MKLSLPENICRLRKENGLTQERLAEVLGVSFAAVSKWERGAATRLTDPSSDPSSRGTPGSPRGSGPGRSGAGRGPECR